MGVLVAVSIPIFTAQLKKARLATNQANARAAYAACVAGLLDKGMSESTCVYTVSEGKAADPTTATTELAITAAPQEWKVDATDNTKDLDDKTAGTWTVCITEDGVSYAASNFLA